MFAHDLRANASRLSQGKTGFHLSGSCSSGAGWLSRTRSNPMCDYSLHAVATRPARVGETLITTTFPGTSTRGFASERDPEVAVCMLPGTEPVSYTHLRAHET